MLKKNKHEADSQEWLAEILLDAIALMMDVVVVDIIVEQELTRIPPDPVSTMVV